MLSICILFIQKLTSVLKTMNKVYRKLSENNHIPRRHNILGYWTLHNCVMCGW